MTRTAPWVAAALRCAVIVGALWVAARVVARGTMENPISLYDAAASTNGFYASTHLLPVAAALLGAAAVAGALDGGWRLPVPALLLGCLIPLFAYALSALWSADPFDARRAVLLAAAWTAEYLALVDAFAGVGRTLPRLGHLWPGRLRPAAGPPDKAAAPPGSGPVADAAAPMQVEAAAEGARAPAAAAPFRPLFPASRVPPLPPRSMRRHGAPPDRGAAGPAALARRPRGGTDAPAGVPAAGWRPSKTSALARALTLAALAAWGIRLALAALRQFVADVPTQVAWTGAAVAKYIPVRVTASFHNPNVFASACILFVACGAALCALPGGSGWRWPRTVLGAASVALGTAALLLTFSRAGYIALALACVVGAVLLPSGARRRAAAVVLPAVVVPFAVLAALVPGVVFRLHTIGVRSGGDVSSRFFSWLDGLRVLLAHPLTGAGPEGIQALYAPFFPLAHFGTYALINVPGGIDNDLLQWLSETGLVGGLALCAGLVLWVAAAWRRNRRWSAAQRAIAAPLIAAFAGLCAQSMLETTLFNFVILVLLIPVAALWTAETGLTRLHRAQGRLYLGLPALAASVLLVGGLRAPWAGDSAYMLGYAASTAGHTAAAERLLDQSVKDTPGSPRSWAALADIRVLAAYRERVKDPVAAHSDAAAAGAALRAATALDPYDAATWDLAAVWEGLEGKPLAQACAQEWSVRDNPYDSGFVLRLAADLQALAGVPGLAAAAPGYRSAGVADIGYAARLLPLVLQVYMEHKFVHAIAAVRQALDYSSATWEAQSPAPFPKVPTLPLPSGVCAPALAATGLAWPAVRLPVPVAG